MGPPFPHPGSSHGCTAAQGTQGFSGQAPAYQLVFGHEQPWRGGDRGPTRLYGGSREVVRLGLRGAGQSDLYFTHIERDSPSHQPQLYSPPTVPGLDIRAHKLPGRKQQHPSWMPHKGTGVLATGPRDGLSDPNLFHLPSGQRFQLQPFASGPVWPVTGVVTQSPSWKTEYMEWGLPGDCQQEGGGEVRPRSGTR